MGRAAVATAAFLICSVSFVPDGYGQQPSFNCMTNTGPDERTICAGAALSQFDRQLGNLYVYVRSSRGGQIARLAIDEASDLALYVASEKPFFAARIMGGKGPRVGEAVVAIGFPFKGLLSSDAIVTTGTISALAGIKNDRRKIQITAPVQPGNSGGPLLGENGSVAGVVVGKLDALKMAELIGDIPQNVNFAVSLGTLQSFLNANGVPYVLDDSTGTKTSADIAADADQYTILLECLRPK